MRLMATVLLALAAVTAGCVADSRPDAEVCAAATIEIDLVLSADALEPSDPAACRGQEVTLRVASEVDGVFHMHGLDEAVPATPVTAGEEIELSFTADRSGQFPVELHPADAPEGISVGVFTVHEP